jgi:membrane protein DedA with SNARE-associated domain
MLVGPITSLPALADHSLLFQAMVIMIGTFFLEDAATIIAAMQAQQGALSIPLALASPCLGIILGDLGLYGLRRLSAHVPRMDRLMSRCRKEAIRAWLRGHIFKLVLICRFVPGMRLPTYTICGFIGADWRPFTLAVLAATACWTSLLFTISLKLGQFLMVHLGTWRCIGRAGFIAFIILAPRAVAAGVQKVQP